MINDFNIPGKQPFLARMHLFFGIIHLVGMTTPEFKQSNNNRLQKKAWLMMRCHCIPLIKYATSPLLWGCCVSTLTDYGHPENHNCAQKSRGSESGNIYPLLLIASLIILRALQHEEGNLGSASSSLPTVAPESTLGGVDLPPHRPFGILRLCAYVCLI